MTPEQVELARKAMALPGWVFATPESHKMEPRRSQRGLLWVRSSHPRGPWVPDLTDYSGATDGVLLKLLGPGWETWSGTSGAVVTQSPSWKDLHYVGATLAEACCKAALAIGRWPGGLP